MLLHKNKDAFKEVLDYLSTQSGIRADILEKDYYVSLILRELSDEQSEIHAYFKGGTALYKISNEMRRFSEDIDLTVKISELSNSQAKKMLERSTVKYQSMNRLKGDPMEENRKGSITSVYGYDSLYPMRADALQRYGKVKVEATSFTVSDPVSSYDIGPLIYQLADEDLKNTLASLGCTSFSIQTLSLERMFADKLLAAEFYLERDSLFDVAKHIYDIHYLLSLPQIQDMLYSADLFIKYLSYKRIEEINRIGSDLCDKPLSDFQLYHDVNSDLLREPYEKMQDIYVFQDKYRVPFSEVQNAFMRLQEIMISISNDEQDFLHSEVFAKNCSAYITDAKPTNVFSCNKENEDEWER